MYGRMIKMYSKAALYSGLYPGPENTSMAEAKHIFNNFIGQPGGITIFFADNVIIRDILLNPNTRMAGSWSIGP